MMEAKDLQKWQREKAKELFDYSHTLLDAAKKLSDHHLAEIEWGMKNALDSAKSAAKNDLSKLKDLQEEAAKEALLMRPRSIWKKCVAPWCLGWKKRKLKYLSRQINYLG
jgi:hypothetical protein